MIYYARHGESLANKEGYFAGLIDSPLTKEGTIQARRIADDIKSEGLAISSLITSPLRRAHDSAKIVAQDLGMPIEDIEVDSRIVEYDFGDLTGKQKKGVDHAIFYATKGRESPVDFHNRVDTALQDYFSREQTVLVIGHSFVRLMMQAIVTQSDYTRFNEIPSDPNDNGLITKISF